MSIFTRTTDKLRLTSSIEIRRIGWAGYCVLLSFLLVGCSDYMRTTLPIESAARRGDVEFLVKTLKGEDPTGYAQSAAVKGLAEQTTQPDNVFTALLWALRNASFVDARSQAALILGHPKYNAEPFRSKSIPLLIDALDDDGAFFSPGGNVGWIDNNGTIYSHYVAPSVEYPVKAAALQSLISLTGKTYRQKTQWSEWWNSQGNSQPTDDNKAQSK